MSSLINDLIIDPVVRQARRFSSTYGDDALTVQGLSNSETSSGSPWARQTRLPLMDEDGELEDVSMSSSRPTTARRLNTISGDIPTRSTPVITRELAESPEPMTGINEDDGPPRGSILSSMRDLSMEDRSTNPSFSSRAIASGNQVLAPDTAQIRSPPELSRTPSGMSDVLPENDGMQVLRKEMHRIRNLALSNEEKARRMHELMMADYVKVQAAQVARMSHALPSRERADTPLTNRSASPASQQDQMMCDNPYNISPPDLVPTYVPITPSTTTSPTTEERHLGCAHYRRNVKVQCSDCRRWYTCRHCHDAVEEHELVRKRIRHMLCMLCGRPQRAAQHCQQCEERMAVYYCDICKLWDNDPSHNIYHCDDCGICRRGLGLGKDYVHCKKCNVCISIAWAPGHRCVEGATERDCPICGDYMFSSAASVVAMRCGHYIHRPCYDAYMLRSYKCPICNRSAVNMEIQWRKLDHAISVQPMPEQYRNTLASIMCIDCGVKSNVPYHWLGNKCAACDSYNTNELKIINNPVGHTGGAAEEVRTRAVNALISDANGSNAGGRRIAEQPSVLAQAEGVDTVPAVPAEPRTIAAADQNVAFHQPIPRTPSSAANLSALPSQSALSSVEEPVSHTSSMSYDEDYDEENDDAQFWGEGVSPATWTLPSIPSAPRWASPRLFARATSSDGETLDETGTATSNSPPNNTAWSLDPRQWRLGSPPRFFSAAFAPDDSRSSPPLRGRSMARTADADTPEPTAPQSAPVAPPPSNTIGLGWGLDPRQWRIASPATIFRGRFAAPDATKGVAIVDDDRNTSPVGRWINPRYLAARFGVDLSDLILEPDYHDDGDDDEEYDDVHVHSKHAGTQHGVGRRTNEYNDDDDDDDSNEGDNEDSDDGSDEDHHRETEDSLSHSETHSESGSDSDASADSDSSALQTAAAGRSGRVRAGGDDHHHRRNYQQQQQRGALGSSNIDLSLPGHR